MDVTDAAGVSKQVCFRVNAVPIAQPRQRQSSRTMKDGRVIAMNYTPKDHPVNVFKSALANQATIAMHGEQLLKAPLHLGVTVVVPRPKGLTKKKKTKGRVPLTTNKGDWDNFGKSVSDALQGIVYDNDCHIYSAFLQKFYAAEEESPHALVLVQQHEPAPPRESA